MNISIAQNAFKSSWHVPQVLRKQRRVEADRLGTATSKMRQGDVRICAKHCVLWSHLPLREASSLARRLQVR